MHNHFHLNEMELKSNVRFNRWCIDVKQRKIKVSQVPYKYTYTTIDYSSCDIIERIRTRSLSFETYKHKKI